MPRGRTIKAPCKGRKSRSCKTAKKTCKWASGSQRSFCRKSRNAHKMVGGGKYKETTGPRYNTGRKVVHNLTEAEKLAISRGQ
uniref:Uncharacterized protein n=1 Tax=viral metagenome TaxID=1070528 RepID=A0A6C0I4P2_9ZZZZ